MYAGKSLSTELQLFACGYLWKVNETWTKPSFSNSTINANTLPILSVRSVARDSHWLTSQVLNRACVCSADYKTLVDLLSSLANTIWSNIAAMVANNNVTTFYGKCKQQWYACPLPSPRFGVAPFWSGPVPILVEWDNVRKDLKMADFQLVDFEDGDDADSFPPSVDEGEWTAPS